MNMIPIPIPSKYHGYTAQELIDLHRKCSFQAGIRCGEPYNDRDKELSEAIDLIEKELLRRMGGTEK